MAFTGTWRRSQEHALAAFDRDRAAGRRRTHVVAPPGSGKTVMGLEMIRRLGTPALVLAPNSAVQGQWVARAEAFGAPGAAGPDPAFPIACLTYQSLCQIEDPAAALGDEAERRWAAERARATMQAPEAALAEGRAFTGEAAARRARELRTITAAIKREIARAEHGDLRLADLLAPGARERLGALRAGGVGTVVLDECHHLASLWGYVVRAAVEQLGDVHLVGLTATPPDGLTAAEAELYDHLLGEVDFEVPTPAVVRDGHLAPYQELAWLTRPLQAEEEWLAEHDERFRELVAALHADPAGPLSFPMWVTTRMRHRGREQDDAAEVSWAQFQRRRPALARAGARFLASAGLPLPPGAPTGEGYREPPGLDDWLVLLEDYAMSCLRAEPSPEAAARDAELGAALRDLGFALTRRGIRRATSDTDRLLTGSAAKGLALVEVLSCEDIARGERLRALVLTDGERAPEAREGALVGVLRPAAQTAPEAVRVLAADARTAGLRPLLVSGRGVRCAAADAPLLLPVLAGHCPEIPADRFAAEPDGDLVRLLARHPAWRPGRWVAAATAVLDTGATRALVGTRAMLGEGWDAPCVNCLVDLTQAATATAVAQMRGRSLRLDPDDPGKIASNWDVVCVAPGRARGDADYERFVRKHLHLYAPGEDGVIEAGPTHVHPALTPFAPPAAEAMDEINRQMTRRAADHAAARERWAVGTPYRDEVLDSLVVRPRRAAAGDPAPGADTHPPLVRPPGARLPVAGGGAVAAGAAAAALALAQPLALAGVLALPVAAVWAGRRLVRAERALPLAMPLDLAALSVRDAYLALGELTPEAGRSLAIEPRASGYLRVWLPDATPAEGARFTGALDDLLAPADAPRYLVSRPVPDRTGALRLLGRAIRGRPPFRLREVAVPRDLGRNRTRADAFHQAWCRWMGPCELVFTRRDEASEDRQAAAGAQAPDHVTARRRVWR
jgi:superfamily II DNA or RNA helicase